MESVSAQKEHDQCCHVGNLESVRSHMEKDPSLINRAGNLKSVKSQLEQDLSLIKRTGNLESGRS